MLLKIRSMPLSAVFLIVVVLCTQLLHGDEEINGFTIATHTATTTIPVACSCPVKLKEPEKPVKQTGDIKTCKKITVPYTLYDRGSDTLIIMGQGLSSGREENERYTRIFPTYDIVMFDYRWRDMASYVRRKDTITAPYKELFILEKSEVIHIVDMMRTRKKYSNIIGLGTCYSALTFLDAQQAAAKAGFHLFDRMIFDSCPLSIADIARNVGIDPTLIANPRLSRLPAWVKQLVRGTRVPWLFERITGFVLPSSTTKLLSILPEIPILFIHGRKDQLIPISSFETIWQSAMPKHSLACITPYAHVENTNNERFYNIVCTAFITTATPEQCIDKVVEYYREQ